MKVCYLRFRQGLAHALTRGMGWGSREPPELPDEVLTQSQDETGEAIGHRPMVVHFLLQ